MIEKLVAIGYHTVCHPEQRKSFPDELSRLSVSAKHFGAHVRYLKDAGYAFLQFRDLGALCKGRQAKPKKAALLYFDDGYRGVLEHAYPFLKKMNIPATLFVTTGFVDGTALPRWAQEDTKQQSLFLTWDDIRGMRDVFEIGSHSVTHTRFTKLKEHEMRAELEVSRSRITSELNEVPTAFSFPHSAWNNAGKELAQEVGYERVIGVGRGFNRGFCGPFLKKIPVGSHDNVSMLEKKLRYMPIFDFWQRVKRNVL